jgi:hypothetical protein
MPYARPGISWHVPGHKYMFVFLVHQPPGRLNNYNVRMYYFLGHMATVVYTRSITTDLVTAKLSRRSVRIHCEFRMPISGFKAEKKLRHVLLGLCVSNVVRLQHQKKIQYTRYPFSYIYVNPANFDCTVCPSPPSACANP